MSDFASHGHIYDYHLENERANVEISIMEPRKGLRFLFILRSPHNDKNALPRWFQECLDFPISKFSAGETQWTNQTKNIIANRLIVVSDPLSTICF